MALKSVRLFPFAKSCLHLYQNSILIYIYTYIYIYDVTLETDDETSFTYEKNPEKGPEGWGKINPHWKTCNIGKFQSPIDLTNTRVSIIRDEAWRRQYKPAPAVIVNRGHDVMVHFV